MPLHNDFKPNLLLDTLSNAISSYLDKLPGKFVTFDDTVVKSMVTRVKVVSQEKIEVTLFDAVTLAVNI